MAAVVLAYGLHAWQRARRSVELDIVHLGLHAALLTLLVNSVADMYFFRLDFQASITLMWLLIGLALASSCIALEESTVVKSQPIQ
jgi:hypothetical protein